MHTTPYIYLAIAGDRFTTAAYGFLLYKESTISYAMGMQGVQPFAVVLCKQRRRVLRVEHPSKGTLGSHSEKMGREPAFYFPAVGEEHCL